MGAAVFYRFRRLARLLKIQFEVITFFVPSITGFGSFTTFYEKNFQKHKNSRTFALANKQPFPMAIFIWIFVSLVVINVLLLVFSNSLRSAQRPVSGPEKAAKTGREVYNFSAGEPELKKAV